MEATSPFSPNSKSYESPRITNLECPSPSPLPFESVASPRRSPEPLGGISIALGDFLQGPTNLAAPGPAVRLNCLTTFLHESAIAVRREIVPKLGSCCCWSTSLPLRCDANNERTRSMILISWQEMVDLDAQLRRCGKECGLERSKTAGVTRKGVGEQPDLEANTPPSHDSQPRKTAHHFPLIVTDKSLKKVF